MDRQHVLGSFGSACQRCGYSRSMQALQFHHIDGTEKRDWSKGKGRASLAEVKAHPDRFLLLCANCHFEEHERLHAERATTMACARCGKVFRIPAYLVASGRRRYCSRPCQYAYRHETATDTFDTRIQKHIAVSGDCWLWTGTTIKGVPVLATKNENGKHAPRSVRQALYAKRYGAAGGPLIPTCDNHACVNPEHLRRSLGSKRVPDLGHASVGAA